MFKKTKANTRFFHIMEAKTKRLYKVEYHVLIKQKQNFFLLYQDSSLKTV